MVGLTGLARAAALALLFSLVCLPALPGCGGSTTESKSEPDAGAKPGGDAGRACPGVGVADQPGVRCRESGECAPNEWCQAYPPSPCSTAPNTCKTDPDCPVEAVCTDGGGTSCFGQGPISICELRCTPSSCSEGDRCEADGHCRPIPCTEGFACANDQVCAPERNADEHGCSAALCEDGWSCPSGFVCQPGEQADQNGCVAISCTAGFECPVNRRCVPDSPYLYTHQCEVLSCEQDADCDCGYCINSACQDALGYCAPPPIG